MGLRKLNLVLPDSLAMMRFSNAGPGRREGCNGWAFCSFAGASPGPGAMPHASRLTQVASYAANHTLHASIIPSAPPQRLICVAPFLATKAAVLSAMARISGGG